MRLVALVTSCLALASCGGGDGAISVSEAVDRDPSEVLRVRGPLVIGYGQAMLCAEMADSPRPECTRWITVEAPSSMIKKLVRFDKGVWWAESVTLRGRVDGGVLTVVP